jgi:hypothetical protein
MYVMLVADGTDDPGLPLKPVWMSLSALQMGNFTNVQRGFNFNFKAVGDSSDIKTCFLENSSVSNHVEFFFVFLSLIENMYVREQFK